MPLGNLALIFVVVVLSVTSILYLLRKKKSVEVESDINIDDKTYTLELMIKFVKKRLDEITKVSAMSKSVFCMLFKEKTGLSFKDYLNRKRIQKAMALIKNGEKTMNVASICGYREFSTFYRNFNKFTSTTPGKYQKSVNKN